MATSAETIAGSLTTRAITPDGLNARIAGGALGNISGSSTSTGSFAKLESAKLDVRYGGAEIKGGLEVNTSSDLGHLDIPSSGAGTLNGVAIGSTTGKEQTGTFTTLTATGNIISIAANGKISGSAPSTG